VNAKKTRLLDLPVILVIPIVALPVKPLSIQRRAHHKSEWQKGVEGGAIS
jgi:hypothetical protein